jgi:NTE family protein
VKTALVLSAGGMFGAYQAGVWQALSRVFQPDVVIGCSAGAINGWAIASGVAPQDLIQTWLDPRCAMLMRLRTSRRPWQPFFDSEPLAQMVRELTSTYTPRIPFALAVTELPRLRLRLVETPHITWRHILASCAIPVAYPSVRIDGRSYCDGGLLCVLPTWAMPRMGADRAIAVNVLPSAPLNAVRAAVRLVRLLTPREPAPTGVEILHVVPNPQLGTLHDAITWEPARVRQWIERGQADAEALIAGPQFAAATGRFV